PRSRRTDSDARSLPLSHTPSELYRCPSSTHVGSLWSCGTHTYAVPVHEPPLPSVATKLIAYTRPFPGSPRVPARSARTEARPSTICASGQVLPSPWLFTGSSWVTLVAVTVTGSPSGSVTPTISTA